MNKLELKETISPERFRKYLTDMSSEFHFKTNLSIDGKRTIIYFRDLRVGAFNTYFLPKLDQFGPDGTVLARGYQHVLSTIWQLVSKGIIPLWGEQRNLLIEALNGLDHYDNPIDFNKIETDEDREIKQIQDRLWNQYGAKVGTFSNI